MWDIFLYTTIFSFIVSVLVLIPGFGETDLQPIGDGMIYDNWVELGNTSVAKPSTSDSLYMSTVGAAAAVLIVFRALLNATILLPWFLSSLLHLPATNPLVLMFTSLAWISYSIGGVQIWRKFSIKQAE